tara:strand:- start:1511 stop:2377 length:867 start_codon:yes stop_codon:yes gene_type:complete
MCKSGKVVSIALSDGAGSYSNSGIGAEEITKRVANNLCMNFIKITKRSKSEIKKRMIAEINRTLRLLIKIHALEKKEFSCTLLFVVSDGNRFIAGHIGDGVIGSFHGNKIDVISTPENYDFSNVTSFITNSDLSKYLRIYRGSSKSSDGFVLMSDGSTDSFYNKKNNKLSKSLLEIKKWTQNYPNGMVNVALEKNMKEFIREKTHDDCSLIMMTKIEKTHHQLRVSNKDFLFELLNAKNKISLKNRMKVLYQISNNKIRNTQLLSNKTSLSESTVRSHKNILNGLMYN